MKSTQFKNYPKKSIRWDSGTFQKSIPQFLSSSTSPHPDEISVLLRVLKFARISLSKSVLLKIQRLWNFPARRCLRLWNFPARTLSRSSAHPSRISFLKLSWRVWFPLKQNMELGFWNNYFLRSWNIAGTIFLASGIFRHVVVLGD